jgi:fructokinase
MSVICMGELLIDFVASETGVSVGEASGFLKAPGGAPANVAVGVAKLGHLSAFLGQVGDDPFGHFLEEVLRETNVDTRWLRFSKEARTALAFVSLRADGERSFVFYRHPSADMLMRPEEVATELISDKRIFHFGSITLISEPSRSATLAAVEHARSRGLLISYDPNLRLALWQDAEAARDGMRLGLEYADIVKMNDEELEFLTGKQDPGILWREGMKIIVVTHGAEGATIYTPREKLSLPGFNVQAVDTTGAGDGFVAGLMHGILTYDDDFDQHLEEIACFANAVGAITTTKRGAIPALPTLAEVNAFLKAHSPTN